MEYAIEFRIEHRIAFLKAPCACDPGDGGAVDNAIAVYQWCTRPKRCGGLRAMSDMSDMRRRDGWGLGRLSERCVCVCLCACQHACLRVCGPARARTRVCAMGTAQGATSSEFCAGALIYPPQLNLP